MQKFENTLIVGATSGIAQHCISELIIQGVKCFVLISRESKHFDVMVSDLQIRHPQIVVIKLKLTSDLEITISEAFNLFDFDLSLVTIGTLKNTIQTRQNPVSIDALISTNISLVARATEAIINECLIRNNCEKTRTIGVFGSVAGDRGRRSNYIYGASKSFLETMVKGMQQLHSKQHLQISIIKPGPTRTKMTSGEINFDLLISEPSSVAKSIVKQLKRGKNVVYAPQIWRLIMAIVRAIPPFIYRQLKL